MDTLNLPAKLPNLSMYGFPVFTFPLALLGLCSQKIYRKISIFKLAFATWDARKIDPWSECSYLENIQELHLHNDCIFLEYKSVNHLFIIDDFL